MISRIACLFAVLFVVGCTNANNSPTDVSVESLTPANFNAAGGPTVEFSVPDMMCPKGCGVAVKGILSKQPGAREVYVDFPAKTAIVAVEAGRFDADAAVAALKDSQFDHSAVKTAAKPQAAD